MSAQPEPMFITDDELAKRLRRVEDALHHLEAVIPTLARELAAIRQQLLPGGGTGPPH